MSNSLNKEITEVASIELEKFSKISYLKKRWAIKSLTRNDLDKYNKWSSSERYKTILIELELEHYLTVNLKHDLGTRDLLAKENFTLKTYSDPFFIKLLNKIRGINEDEETSPADLQHLSFGEKIWFWSGLKKDIFKNKFFRWDIKAKQKNEIAAALNNIRKVRNGIAHMNSRDQIEFKMSRISISDETKELQFQLKKAKLQFRRTASEEDGAKYSTINSTLKKIYYRNSFKIWETHGRRKFK